MRLSRFLMAHQHN